MYTARILCDSLATANGCRITTWELIYWRAVHDELMTHREFSRNTASARAIPIERMMQSVIDDPALPLVWGGNRAGMQPGEEIDPAAQEQARTLILKHRDAAVQLVKELTDLGLHKQIVNRYLQPYAFTTVLVTATSFSNWFGLRCAPAAQAEIRHIAMIMQEQYKDSTPALCSEGAWHLPLITHEEQCEWDPEICIKVSVARCARVSYMRHLEQRDMQDDLDLHDRLLSSGHMSPFEHVAQAMGPAPFSDASEGIAEFISPDKRYTGAQLLNDLCLRSGNFRGWRQYRKTLPGEYIGGVMF